MLVLLITSFHSPLSHPSLPHVYDSPTTSELIPFLSASRLLNLSLAALARSGGSPPALALVPAAAFLSPTPTEARMLDTLRADEDEDDGGGGGASDDAPSRLLSGEGSQSPAADE